ncbi:unnamed protein product [Mycena citricolor]|uniref:Uncharacterized protein n=1 Tax=Mycena citricolor TaxID=2018698 RepID=A0AAD2GZT2_9AGAR|nr:unnamed protein product [Mycena citricolor]
MHIVSTVNAKNQSHQDIPVVLVSFDETRKFLPRCETYKEMQRIVKLNFGIDARTALILEVSTWDVCAGQNVEVTEGAYTLLAPFIDTLTVAVDPTGLARNPPATTLSWPEDTEVDMVVIQPDVARSAAPSSSRHAGGFYPTPEAEEEEEEEEEEVDRSIHVQDDNEEDPPHSRRALTKELSEARSRTQPNPGSATSSPKKASSSKQLTPKVKPAPIVAASRNASIRSNQRAESSQAAANATQTSRGDDERFKISITGPDNERAEFTTRGGHSIRKVLGGACKNFDVDFDQARLFLFSQDRNGRTIEIECDKDETVAQAGLVPHCRLIIRMDEDDSVTYVSD